MTSLIDVIFLLLLFFMLSSTFTKFAEIPLTTGGASAAPAAASATPPIFLRLSAEEMSVNGQPVEIDALADRLQELRDGEDATVLVTIADDETTSQQLIELLVTLRGLPDLNVTVLE
ncbi:biopolymer transporter ExbD [Pseudoruegeria sp. HB172150]|uniref:ExbD/TolR family protein n=1 Tax=Pseudoruegeria sp. HB172150 TaxID=2721164 RepID=UPI00155431D2|nr:biopolymer transporter ExbD [Pseudoruegeria sp. HB172150]